MSSITNRELFVLLSISFLCLTGIGAQHAFVNEIFYDASDFKNSFIELAGSAETYVSSADRDRRGSTMRVTVGATESDSAESRFAFAIDLTNRTSGGGKLIEYWTPTETLEGYKPIQPKGMIVVTVNSNTTTSVCYGYGGVEPSVEANCETTIGGDVGEADKTALYRLTDNSEVDTRWNRSDFVWTVNDKEGDATKGKPNHGQTFSGAVRESRYELSVICTSLISLVYVVM